MTEEAPDVPDRPQGRARGAGRGGHDGGARRPAGPRSQRRLPAASPATDDATARRASCSASCPQRVGVAPRRSSVPLRRSAIPPPSVPAEARRVYDVRDVVGAIADDGQPARALGRAGPRTWSPGFARIEGRPVGLVANQPRRLGGVIDAAGAEKAAAVRRPLRPLRPAAASSSSTPRASCPAAEQERAGVIRHGASLLRAFAVGDGAEGDPGPPQGLRRRGDHDELP